eukprot:scaffold13389_cov134-Isochrysis_galbana.AAC.6
MSRRRCGGKSLYGWAAGFRRLSHLTTHLVPRLQVQSFSAAGLLSCRGNLGWSVHLYLLDFCATVGPPLQGEFDCQWSRLPMVTRLSRGAPVAPTSSAGLESGGRRLVGGGRPALALGFSMC